MTRLYAYGLAVIAALAVVGGLAWYIHHSGYKAGKTSTEARMQARVEEANLRASNTEKAASARVETLEKSHAEEIAGLDARYRAALARAPRVQKCPSSSQLPKPTPDPPERDGGADGDRSAGQDGIDIGPALIEFARDAEAVRLALKACQAYGREIEIFRGQ